MKATQACVGDFLLRSEAQVTDFVHKSISLWLFFPPIAPGGKL
jgi:hypothetical protein